MEVTTKYRIGKLSDSALLANGFIRQIASQGFIDLDVTVDHAQRAGLLPGPHKDPFDRLLIAQAQAENLALVSNEAVFDRYGVTRVW